MHRLFALPAILVILATSLAQASTLAIRLTFSPDGSTLENGCVAERWMPGDDSHELAIQCTDVTGAPVTLPSAAVMTLRRHDRTAKKYEFTESTTDRAPESPSGLQVFVEFGGKEEQIGVTPAVRPERKGNGIDLDRAEQTLHDWRVQSETWLRSEKKISGHAVEKGLFGKKWMLYHLADGSLAFPPPRHVAEEDEVHLLVVVPLGGRARFEILACQEVPPIRVRSDFEAAKGLLRLGEPTLAAPGFELQEYPGQALQCAAQLEYEIRMQMPAGGEWMTVSKATTKIPIDPIYRFTWSVGFAFDFGQRPRFDLVDRQNDVGDLEKVIDRRNERHGDHALVMLQLHPFGANPNDWSLLDGLVSPFLALDPNRIDEGFVLGNALSPFAGFNLLVGVSLFEQQELQDQLGLAEGSVWNVAGELPTRSIYGDDCVGFLVGATFSTDVFKALTGR